jgi:hypothetical protein
MTVERVDPARTHHPSAGPQLAADVVDGEHRSARPYLAHVDTALLEHQPGEDGGGKVAGHQQHLVARLQRQPLGQMVDAVRGAVAQDDIFRLRSDEPA